MKKNEISAIICVFAALIAFLTNAVMSHPGADTFVTFAQGIITAIEALVIVFCASYVILFLGEAFAPKQYKKILKFFAKAANKAVNATFGED